MNFKNSYHLIIELQGSPGAWQLLDSEEQYQNSKWFMCNIVEILRRSSYSVIGKIYPYALGQQRLFFSSVLQEMKLYSEEMATTNN